MDLREPLIEATKKLKALRDQVDELQHRAHEPIAIVGMACRLPGGVDSPESLWRVLDEGRDAIEPFPPHRWNAEQLYSADADEPGKTYCTQGGFVRDVDRFDAAFFGIAPREAESMDPAQRIALECTWEALERAAIRPAELSHSQTGVYLGTVYSDYEPWGGRLGMVGMDGYGFTGRDGSVLSGRISYTLGLQGPAITINTACSSSLVALHLAAHALRSGECQLAICGGSQVMTTPGCFVEFSRLRGMSTDGRCKSFSDDANGVGWAEGCAIVVLQRLSDAQREGRRVLAIVRGTATNQDGRSQGLTAPNGPAQERVIQRALHASGLARDDIDAVEAHGTGTSLGDPIEAGALSAVFGPGRAADRPLYLGSLKSNLGHTQAASGVAGVIKMVLALSHDKLPRTLHAETPSRRITWQGSGLQLLHHDRPWLRSSRPRRAGVNSFGISGTNAHVILEEPPAIEADADAAGGGALREVPLVLSAATEAALVAQAGRLADHVEASGATTRDLAYSLATTRTHHAARLAVSVPVDEPPAAIAAALRAFARGEVPAELHTHVVERQPGKLVMLFSGQGSQRPGMGKQLYERLPVFRSALEALCGELDRRLPQPLLDVMFAAPDTAGARLLDQTEYTQPALFALEVALYRQWEAWGVVPDLLLGHSIGELAAAHIAGVLSLADACALVAARGRLMQRAASGGAMVSIAASDQEVAELLLGLEDRVSLAAVNGPAQSVISGDAATVEAIAAQLQAHGKRVQRLRVSHAFHSPHMDCILDEFRDVARSLTYHVPRIAMLANLNGALATDRVATADYWVRQLRGAVRFREAVRTADTLGAARYIECGPRAVLSAMAADCTQSRATFVASLQHAADETGSLVAAAARAHLYGATLHWEPLFAGLAARRVDLPTYGFQRERYWLDGAGRGPRDVESVGMTRFTHELLGAETPLATGGHLFTARLASSAVPWLADHQVFGHVVVPGMALAELLAAAGSRLGSLALRELTLEAPLVVSGDALQVQLHVEPGDARGRCAFQLHARASAAPWTRHASGSFEPAGTDSLAAPRGIPVDATAIDLAGLYERLAGKGLTYGPSLRALHELLQRGHELFGRVALPPHLTTNGYAVHPALLDACLHAVLAIAPAGAELRIPFELAQVRVLATTHAVRELNVHVVIGERDASGMPVEAAIDAYDGGGQRVAAIGRIGFRTVSRDKLTSAAESSSRLDARDGELYRLDWVARPAPVRRGRPGRCAVVGSGPTSNEIAAALRDQGAQVVRFDHPAALPERLTQDDGAISLVVRALDVRESAGADAALRDTTALLSELQAWLRGPRAPECRYALVTSGAVATGPRGPVAVEHAPLWGLVRTLRNEHPDRAWLLLDTDGTEASFEVLGAALLGDDEPEVALRDGRRLVPRLVRAEVPALAARLALPADGTVLITGGTTGLGAEVAKHLARHHAVKHLLLVSRRGPSGDGAAALVQELAGLGATATCAACDVGDASALTRVLATIADAHPLVGVFHAAAVLGDGFAASLSGKDIERVFAPKVAGAWNLHQLTQHLPLSAFVMFSSLAGIIGNEGQSGYAAANTFLDALAATRQRLGLAARSLAWGPWAEVGMAARQSQSVQERFGELGLAPLPPRAALALMDRALQSSDPLLVAMRVDAKRIASSPSTALARLLASAPPSPAAAPSAASTSPAKRSLREDIAGAEPEGRTTLLLDLVRTEVAVVLKLPTTDHLREDRRLDELGMDSLMAVDIRRRLEARLAMQLPATVVFDHPSCGQLVQYLREAIGRSS